MEELCSHILEVRLPPSLIESLLQHCRLTLQLLVKPHVASMQCSHVASMQCSHVASMQCSHVASMQCSHVASMQCSHVASMQCWMYMNYIQSFCWQTHLHNDIFVPYMHDCVAVAH